MINNAASKDVGREKQGEALKKIAEEYGIKDEKTREPVKKLGKDDFFRIMVTQLKNQDPTKPYDNEQMAAQMAQFTSLEQMINMNSNIEKLADAQKPLFHLGAAGLINKWVTSDSSRVTHTEGKYTEFKFTLPAEAQNVRMSIMNEKGEVIREISKQSMSDGTKVVKWDGKRANNMQAPTGVYSVQIRAENEQGKPLVVNTSNKYQIHGIAFEGKETVLLAGDPKNPQKLLLRSVAKIETDPESEKNMSVKNEKKVEAVSAESKQSQEQSADNADSKSKLPQQNAETQAVTAATSTEGQVVQEAMPGQAAKFESLSPDLIKGLLGNGNAAIQSAGGIAAK